MHAPLDVMSAVSGYDLSIEARYALSVTTFKWAFGEPITRETKHKIDSGTDRKVVFISM